MAFPMTSWLFGALLIFSQIAPGWSAGTNKFIDPDPNPNKAYEENDMLEFEEFCQAQSTIRNTPEKLNKQECKKIGERDFHMDDLYIIFVIFMVLLWGAMIRSVRKYFPVPYTVIVMGSGMIMGIIAKYYCYNLYAYTALARVNAKIILFTFLPVLIFESSFSISGHVFVKAVGQVLLLAGPGMLMCTVLTAFVCYTFFTDYEWTFLESMFFGCIISATDPVAVVCILKELGVSETLGVLVDGESLLNDGIAILLYEVIGELIEKIESGDDLEAGELVEGIALDFLRIAIGGPIFGWIMAKITIFCLNRIFNDAVVEITITLVSAYLTYYLGEAVLGVSGVMAVVLLGITMSSEKTCISPETKEEVDEFWEMLGHLANTVLFFITGVIITERGTRSLAWEDLYYLLLLYCALNLIRFCMLLTMSPILTRIGYGMPWQNMIVMMWGGLRGAVGICLSLEVYEDVAFCKKTMGPKILIQTAGIVFLTLTINGTTTKKLLELLKLTEISPGRMEEMHNALKHVLKTQKKALLMLRHDRFLTDANWTYVQENTLIENPYKKDKVRPTAERKSSLLSLGPENVANECPECHAYVPNQPTNEELKEMTDDARLRVIKAMKISFWAHFERGVLTELAVQILAGAAETCEDKTLYMIHTKDLKKYWEIRGIFPWIRAKLVKQIGEESNVTQVPAPPAQWKYWFWWLATKNWFEYLITSLVIVNMIPAIWQLIFESKYDQCSMDPWVLNYEHGFQYCNLAFTMVYIAEFIIKVIGLGFSTYWSSKWNWLDAAVLAMSIVDVLINNLLDLCSKGSHAALRNLFKVVKIVRCFRCIKLLKPMIPVVMDYINGKINTQLFLGYDVALGFIVACDDVLKFLPQMIENKKVYNKIKTAIEKERMETVREMGLLQKDHPGIAIAIKTRHASRSVLNQMKTMLVELRQDGLLDEKENDLLTIVLEERMKRLWNSPSYIAPPKPEVLLRNLNWIIGNSELRDYIFQNATLLQFEAGDVIVSMGDEPQGIYVVISGMVRIRFEPTHGFEAQNLHTQWGVIPNMEIFRDFEFDKPTEDYFSSGTVIGESGVLTGQNRAASVICETEGVKAFHIPLIAMKDALESFNDQYDSLEERLWRSCGMRRGSNFLLTQSAYHSLTKEKLETMLERTCVPIGPQFQRIRIPSYVQDIIVIEGWVTDDQTGDTYKAPCLIPKACNSFNMLENNPKTMNRVMLIINEGQGPSENDSDELSKCVLAAKKFRISSDDSRNRDDVKIDMNESDSNLNQQKQRRQSMAVNFGVRQKNKRPSQPAVLVGKTKSRTKDTKKGDAQERKEQ